MGDFFKSTFGASSKEPLIGNEAPSREKTVKRVPASERMKRTLEAAAATVESKDPDSQIGTCLRATAPILTLVMQGLAIVGPLYVKVYKYCYDLYIAAPKLTLKIVFGLALCGFGGTFTASIAAIEAFRQMGGATVFESVSVVWGELMEVKKANDADDKVDADKDGIADVDQIPPHELATRKITVAMTAVKQPAKLQEATVALWAAYIAVLATLRLQFARTTAMAMGIIEVVEYPIIRVLAPPFTSLLGPKLQHWSETLLDSGIKLIAIIFAWYLQMIISAFYSALRGGRMVADGLCDLVVEQGWQEYVEKLPGVAAPFDPDTTYLDEAILYPVAALGFSYQLLVGFTLPFPLNLLLLPLTIVEWILRWQITFTGSADVAGAGR